jgi:hypothetical protein
MTGNEKLVRRSVCSITAPDYNGKIWLKRLGDIDENGRMIPFNFDPEQSKVFDNRNRIFWNDGPDVEGTIGIWDWSAIPNLTSPGTDYIQSHFDSNVSPIQIIEISGAYTLNELLDALKDGVADVSRVERIMFIYQQSHGNYEGVLCEKKHIENVAGKLKLAKSVVSLDVYKFDDKSIFTTKGIEFYKYINPGDSDNVILTRTHSDIIKEIIIRRASWSVAKQNGMSKANWKMFKTFIDMLSDDSIYNEISSLCNCTKDEAKKYLKDFVEMADRAIEESDIDREILVQIIEGSESLRKMCEAPIEAAWEERNRVAIEDKLKELDKIEDEIKSRAEKKKTIEHEIEEAKKQLQKIVDESAEYEKMGDAVKDKVKFKIEEARKDAAEFISQMIFNTSSSPIITNEKRVGARNLVQENNAYFIGAECNEGEISSYTEALESIADEMGEAGVQSQYVTSLAAYIYSAYTNRVHLIIAGPNAISIANAFSIGLCGKYAGVLDCSVDYSKDAIKQVLSSEDEIIIVKNPFAAKWIDDVIHLVEESNKFFVLVTPFVEDLLIEPKGIFNYVQPLFTESFVAYRARMKYLGKKQSEGFEKYERRKEKPLYGELLSDFKVNGFQKNKVQRILTDMHYLDKDSNATEDYMYVLLPYAYLTRQEDVLIEKIKTENQIDSKIQRFIINYLGAIDE